MWHRNLTTQIIVATQSSDLIGWLAPEEVLIADKEDWEDLLYVGRRSRPQGLAGRVHTPRPVAEGQPGWSSMTIVLLVEGDTEQALKEHLCLCASALKLFPSQAIPIEAT